jgi:predicted kinase
MNPWHKRANEFIRDAGELLPLISPQPISKFFSKDADRLFDRLVVVVGAPGSGKTTLARLLELRTLAVMRDFARNNEVRDLLTSLSTAGILDDLNPAVVALRLPTGGQLRSIWALPYDERLRHRLLRAMIQAKSVLGWLRQLEEIGIDIKHVRVVTTGLAEAAREAVRADDIVQFRERARTAERTIFKLTGALVPPPESALGDALSDVSYEPFSIVESLEVADSALGPTRKLRPMVILDDAHELHPLQLEDVDTWLRDREIKIARWVLTRADSLNLEEFRRVLQDEERATPGTQPGRDRVRVLLQDTGNRDRQAFKSVAEDVARRYFQPLTDVNRRGAVNLKAILNAAAEPALAEGDLRILEAENARLIDEIGLSAKRLADLEASYPADVGPDVKAALTRIMLQREMRRTPQRSLFGSSVIDEEAPDFPRVPRSLINGAKLQLLHRFDRPFYHGFECLADAANENIEQFVTLASVLVDQLETQAIRGKSLRLDARQQHKAIRRHASTLVSQWDFPYAPKVQRLVTFIAERCIELTMRPNAPLADGANAYGISIAELASLDPNEELTRVLHYAIAYQAIVLIEPYECKGKTWALLELGGVPIISSGLTLNRGGFAEGSIAQLKSALESVS